MLRKRKSSLEISTWKVKACREIITKEKTKETTKKLAHIKHRKSKQEKEKNLRNIEE
jgi:hypothetical protein